MKGIVSLLFVCLFATQAVHSFSVNFAGNVSANYDINANAADWGFRKTSFTVLDLGGLYGGAFFSSISTGGTKYSAAGDAIWGATTVILGGLPTSFLAYWAADYNISGNNNVVDTDVSKAAGFVANSYAALVEKDADGKVVTKLSLANTYVPVFNADGVHWEVVAENTEGNPKSVTLGGSNPDEKWAINITFIVSDVIGVLAQGGAIVSPKSLESIVTIENWPYKSATNTLTLVIATATGDASESHDGRTLISGDAQSKVYFSLSGSAVVNGQSARVDVSAFADAKVEANFDGTVSSQLSSLYSSNIASKIVNVTFPAGAQSILYDPSTGAGEPVQEKGSAAMVAANAVVVVIVALVSVLVM